MPKRLATSRRPERIASQYVVRYLAENTEDRQVRSNLAPLPHSRKGRIDVHVGPHAPQHGVAERVHARLPQEKQVVAAAAAEHHLAASSAAAASAAFSCLAFSCLAFFSCQGALCGVGVLA
jgi:hypothetical protein